jgi:hypothetical protein
MTNQKGKGNSNGKGKSFNAEGAKEERKGRGGMVVARAGSRSFALLRMTTRRATADADSLRE